MRSLVCGHIGDPNAWKQFGEGPALENVAALSAQGFNEGKGKPFVSQDIRFAQKGEALYATVMAWPQNGQVMIKNLSRSNYKEIVKVELVSKSQQLKYQQTEQGLVVDFPHEKPLTDYAHALKIV
jgi:alpha-L-fucosidase